MLIDGGSLPEGLQEPVLRWHSDERLWIGWKGHVYRPGRSGGEETIAAVAADLATRPLAEIVPALGGVFGLFVFDRQRRTWHIAVDNAGLYKVFHAGGIAATSFLELVRKRPDLRGSLQPEAVIDFVAHGCVYGPATFLSGIRKLRADEVLELDPRHPGPVRLSTKRLPLPPVDSEAVLARIGHLARSLAGRKVSADLTGGADTRLLVCLLRRHGLDPELAVCGLPDSADVVIAERIASLLGSPLLTNQPDLSALDDELEQCFLAGDGQIDSAFFHIDWRHAQVRLARGVEVIVHGGGGAHFKDFYAFQDFPLYGRSRANFRRYYDLRVCPVELPRHYFTLYGAEIASQARERALAAYEPYAGPTNNESYDRVSYFLRAPEFHGGNYATYINIGLDVAAPLLEYENALVGMRLSPWLRFFNGWHRRVLSAHCPTLAALPTTEGYSTSTALRHLVPDTLGYTRTQGRRAIKKAAQRLLGRTVLDRLGAATVNDPMLLPRVRASRAFGQALDQLKAAGLLAPELSASDVRGVHVGRLLTAGLFLRELATPDVALHEGHRARDHYAEHPAGLRE